MSGIAGLLPVTSATRLSEQRFSCPQLLCVLLLYSCSNAPQKNGAEVGEGEPELSNLSLKDVKVTSAKFANEGIDASPIMLSSSMRPEAWVVKDTKWANPRINVCWESSAIGFVTEQKWIQEALQNTWVDASAINFVGFAACPEAQFDGIRVGATRREAAAVATGNEIAGIEDGIRINFQFANWHSEDCAASDKARKSCLQETSVHEFGHALGFVHEHNQNDDLKPPGCRSDSQPQIGDLVLTRWDLESVMNYCRPNALKRAGELSKYDRQSVALFYGNEI